MSTVAVTNTDAGLSATKLLNAEGADTVTGLKTFDRDPNPPFAVSSGSAVVPNLDADKLDGLDSTAFPLATSGTLTSPTINTSFKSTTMFGGLTNGRLTLTSSTPVTTADVTGAVTIYFTPYQGNLLALYDGSTKWTVYPFTELSLAVGTLTNDLPYDVFVYDNAGTPTLEFAAWTSKTARVTNLTTQNGVLVKTGAITRKYLGTFHTTSTTTTEDSYAKRLLWNYYNRMPRGMVKNEATNSWTYGTAAFQQANASTANQLAVVIGWAEVAVDINLLGHFSSNNLGGYAAVALGEDSTTTPLPASQWQVKQNDVANDFETAAAHLTKIPAVGYHFYAWLEYANTPTVTFYGDNGVVYLQSGMSGMIQG